MSNNQTDNFRSIEFWKASIMILPDNAFFELVRTVFGKIKTPFNKQVLADDLEKFLTRTDIQKNVASYIDGQDSRMISAVAILNEPAIGELENFFRGDLNYAELNDVLVNLEERFILYRFQDEDKKQNGKRLALNPVFKSILLPFIADSSSLFYSVSKPELAFKEKDGIATDTSGDNVVDNTTGNNSLSLLHSYDDRIFAVMLSFVSMNELFYIAKDGGVRKKVLNSAKTIFPDLPFEMLIEYMKTLGLFLVDDEKLIPDYKRFLAFGRLSRKERTEYYTSAVFCYEEQLSGENQGIGFAPWSQQSKLRTYGLLINRLCRKLEADRLYPLPSIQKFAYTLTQTTPDFPVDKIIDTMAKTGLLVPAADGYWQKKVFAQTSEEYLPTALPPAKALIAMDTSFSLMVYPEIDYADIIKIAIFSHVSEAGLNVSFEINRDSVVVAFNLGLDATAIIELLRRLSQNRIDENLVYALQDWEKSHREVTIRHGAVLTLSPERQYLAETRPLSTFISETIAPGIYMIPSSMEERAVRALNKAGVNIIARHGETSNSDVFSGNGKPGDTVYSGSSYFAPLDPVNLNGGIFGSSSGQNTETEEKPESEIQPDENASDSVAGIDSNAGVESAGDLIKGFHSMLEKMHLDSEKHDELAGRIDRKLILSDAQLTDAVLRYEKLEAYGLDYAGKTMIARQAISIQSLVEVRWPVNQKSETVIGIPKSLEKSGADTVFVIKSINDDTGMLRIPIGKISLLRRIKKSIFETSIT